LLSVAKQSWLEEVLELDFFVWEGMSRFPSGKRCAGNNMIFSLVNFMFFYFCFYILYHEVFLVFFLFKGNSFPANPLEKFTKLIRKNFTKGEK
jgi:hypothetical protein